MTERHERSVAHTELTLLSFHCRNCEAESTLDWNNPKQKAKMLELAEGKTVIECSFCNHKFDLKFSQALGSFRDFLVCLEEAGQVLTLRIPYSETP